MYLVALRVSGGLKLRRRCQFIKLEAKLLAEEILRAYDLGVDHIQPKGVRIQIRHQVSLAHESAFLGDDFLGHRIQEICKLLR